MIQNSLFGSRRVNPSSELDEESLQRLADETGGYYFRARASEDMSKIYKLLDDLEPVEQEQQQMRPLSALFYWPLGLALLISLLTLLVKSLSNTQLFVRKKELSGGKH
jgi:Ca-activated chloride channel family protein